MRKNSLLIVLFITGMAIVLCTSSCNQNVTKTEETLECPALPKNFEESDLIGTWVGRYFGDVDTLIIRDDGMYKQIYSNNTISFESDWQKWWLEYDQSGYIRLHLNGMRRCDDHEICNTPGGGLPPSVMAINPCEPEYINYSNEVILFVSGYEGNITKGIVLRQAKLAGGDWNWGYQLQK